MLPKPNKRIAWLLALLLVLMPLQGLLASVASMGSKSAPAPAAQQMGGQADMEQMSMDCQNCDQHDCCEQGSCDLQHCVSCVITAAVIPGASHDFHAFGHGAVSVSDHGFPADHHRSLYRPPRG